MMRRGFGWCLLLLVGLACSPRVGPRVRDGSDAFFAGPIVRLELRVKPEDAEKINREERPWVPCTLIEYDATGAKLIEYPQVAIKLKGAAGSFRGFEDRPALTLRPDKYIKGQLFHALTKFHLNNSVQDETFLHEQLCSEIFLEANVPAARVTHARVKINDRDLGLYVLKEGFDRRFLARHFARPNGNLYDGGFCTDIDQDLERDTGEGPEDRQDLQALREACHEPDAARRTELVAKRVDVDALLTFVALELMTCHWDGYACNANNYRLYFDPADGRARFFPHGMDQMFGDPGFSIVAIPNALVARTLLEDPAQRERFKQRVNELLPRFSPADKLVARVDALAAKIKPFLATEGDPDAVARFEGAVQNLKERLVARAQYLDEQKSFPAPKPVEFDDEGRLHLTDWRPASEVEDAALDVIELEPDRHAFKIACGPGGHCIASWRTNVLLSRGAYTFVARARCRDLQAITDDKGLGAGLRISGAVRENQIEGTRDWQEYRFDFTIDEDSRPIEFVAELRATGGEVEFAAESLRVERRE